MKRRQFIGYSSLFLTGCSVSTVQSQSSESRQRPTQLRFAVTDLSGLDALSDAYEPFRAALENVIGLPITFYPVPNYSAAAPALLSNDLELAFAGPSEYLWLRARAQAEPLVAISRKDYYSVAMVRADSEVKTLADLQGKTVAMRTEGSTAGHIFPMKLLIDAGLDPEEDFRVKMLDRDAFDALRRSEVDAWIDSYDRYATYVEQAGLADKEIVMIAQGEPLPGDVLVANPSLGAKFIEEVRSQLLSQKETLLNALAASEATAKYRESDMLRASDIDYDGMRDIYRDIGQESAIQ